MSDSFGAKHDCVMNVLTISLVSLSTVEKGWHLLLAAWILSGNDFDIFSALENILCELSNLGSVVLLIYHVESSDELGNSLIVLIYSIFNVLKHLINMLLSHDL